MISDEPNFSVRQRILRLYCAVFTSSRLMVLCIWGYQKNLKQKELTKWKQQSPRETKLTTKGPPVQFKKRKGGLASVNDNKTQDGLVGGGGSATRHSTREIGAVRHHSVRPSRKYPHTLNPHTYFLHKEKEDWSITLSPVRSQSTITQKGAKYYE